MIRVLWFSLSPCGSMRRNDNVKVTQGWMISLEDEIKRSSSIELHVAYYSETEKSDFVFDSVHYYPMSIRFNSSVIERFWSRHRVPRLFDNKLHEQLHGVIHRVMPDLIHICGTESNFGIVADSVKNIPIVYSLQGMMAPINEKLYSGLPYSYLCKQDTIWSRIMGNDTKARNRKFNYEAKREIIYLKNANYVIGRTDWDNQITHLLNPEAKYYTVNEILRTPFYNSVWNKKAFSTPFTIVSTISPGIYKGYETLLKTAKLLKDYGKTQFVWEIIGLSDDDRYTRLCEEYSGIKTAECNVKLLGRRDASEMVDLFCKADLFCHTGHIENSPNSVCEAMIVGMPVIASNVGGTGSMLEHKKEGVLVQDGDPYGLAGAILEIKNNYDKAKVMGKNARNRALERHNAKTIGEALLLTYQQILSDYENK